MSVDGLWTVEFSSTLNLFGTGIVVLNNKRLLGGDFGYYYSGTYSTSGETLEAKIDVTRFDKNAISVFGNIDQFSLIFTAKISNGEFNGIAYVDGKPGLKIRVTGKKKENI